MNIDRARLLMRNRPPKRRTRPAGGALGSIVNFKADMNITVVAIAPRLRRVSTPAPLLHKITDKSRHQKICVRRRVRSEVPAGDRAQVIEMVIKRSSFLVLAVPLAREGVDEDHRVFRFPSTKPISAPALSPFPTARLREVR
jgi:hypothetical protein